VRLLIPACALLIGCAGPMAGSEGPGAGTFRYTATGPGGSIVLAGILDLEFPDDSTVLGHWAIAWIPGADTTLPVGPQVGAGSLAGSKSGDTLLIQLNPGNADNNVGLKALAAASGYHGWWEWVTLTGPRTEGSFAAVP
jgi:hypothetical protein